MKLHLPKVLFTAVVAAVCCVQQAMAAVETKTYTINGESVNVTTYTGTENNMNPNRDLTTGTAENIIAFETTGGYFIQNGFSTSRDIYISKGGATDDTKTGLVLTNGWGGNVYTFTGNVYGDGDIYKYDAPPTGVTLKFTGDMSSFTGRIITEGANAANKLIFDGATTGTGSISSNGTVSISSTTINNSSISSTKTITLDGATVNSAVEMSATEGIILQSKLNTSSENANLTITGTTVKVTLGDLLAGGFGDDSVGYDQGGGAISREANGKLRLKNFSVFSDANKAQLQDGSKISIAGTDITYTSSSVTATYSSVYGIAVDTVYSSSNDIVNAGVLILDNSATLTLDAPTWTSSNGQKAFHVVGANTGIKLSGETATLKETDLTVHNGGKVTISGNGVFTVADKQLGSGIAMDDTTWTGTVKYIGSAGNNNLANNLSKLGNANSTIELTGAGGHLDFNSGVLANQHLVLKDNGDTKALTILDGGSGTDHTVARSYLAAKITGSGTLVYAFKGNYNDRPISAINFEGDISGWNGRFVYSNSNITETNEVDVYFTAKATEINAAISNDCAGKLNLIVDNSSKTTTFNNTVNATSVTTTEGSSVKLGKGGDMTTGSFSLGDGGTLTLAGGTLTVTDSITLSTVTVDFSQYFDATQLVKTLVTADGGINDWAGDLAGTYTADGTKYTTSVKKDGNSIVLTFEGLEPELTSLTVDTLSLSLADNVLTLNIDKDLTGMTGAIDLTLSDAALATLAGLPAGDVSLLLQGSAGSIDSLDYDAAISFYGSYVGDGGMYKVEYIPEPATATLSLAALMMLAARRRRRA